eukprot:TRINITY_DN8807_c0_g1_i1.p1 TRINITY_DN8807_c0_g1~~TRINITY_DN8807_c0_g1_i1.p1  ORF type:complete len:450 (-),score=123.85 TRINITY_DN8807_c0_g1_i1:13-1362(-)
MEEFLSLFDLRKSGFISDEDFDGRLQSLLETLNLEPSWRLFHQISKGEAGISFAQFSDLFARLGEDVEEDTRGGVFGLLDGNQDGLVEFTDVVRMKVSESSESLIDDHFKFFKSKFLSKSFINKVLSSSSSPSLHLPSNNPASLSIKATAGTTPTPNYQLSITLEADPAKYKATKQRYHQNEQKPISLGFGSRVLAKPGLEDPELEIYRGRFEKAIKTLVSPDITVIVDTIDTHKYFVFSADAEIDNAISGAVEILKMKLVKSFYSSLVLDTNKTTEEGIGIQFLFNIISQQKIETIFQLLNQTGFPLPISLLENFAGALTINFSSAPKMAEALSESLKSNGAGEDFIELCNRIASCHPNPFENIIPKIIQDVTNRREDELILFLELYYSASEAVEKVEDFVVYLGEQYLDVSFQLPSDFFANLPKPSPDDITTFWQEYAISTKENDGL